MVIHRERMGRRNESHDFGVLVQVVPTEIFRECRHKQKLLDKIPDNIARDLPSRCPYREVPAMCVDGVRQAVHRHSFGSFLRPDEPR